MCAFHNKLSFRTGRKLLEVSSHPLSIQPIGLSRTEGGTCTKSRPLYVLQLPRLEQSFSKYDSHILLSQSELLIYIYIHIFINFHICFMIKMFFFMKICCDITESIFKLLNYLLYKLLFRFIHIKMFYIITSIHHIIIFILFNIIIIIIIQLFYHYLILKYLKMLLLPLLHSSDFAFVVIVFILGVFLSLS